MTVFGVERLDMILNMLSEERVTSVRDMSRQLFISAATIRRDLTILEQRGLVKRIYGGALLTKKTNRDIPLYIREGEHTEAKEIIGKQAAALVKRNNVLIIDASSTAFHVARHLPERENLVVITNGIKAAVALGEKHIKTLVTGGTMIDNSFCFVGQHAHNMIANINADILFFSCRGVSVDGLMTDTSTEECDLRQVMFQHAKRKVLLCASAKIGCEFFYRLGTIADVDDVICEAELPKAWKRMLG